jgi:hypothetical protein
MTQERLNQSTEGKMLVFTDHIMYEIKMLQMTYGLLGVPWYSGWVGNALIESFCVHARALIDFFEKRRPETDEQVCACHFTDNSYQPFPSGKVDGPLRGKLQAQIAHLSYQRAKDDDDKIGPEDRKTLLTLINREIDHFAAHLRSPFKDQWPSEFRSKTVSFSGLFSQANTALVTGSIVQPCTLTPGTTVALFRE